MRLVLEKIDPSREFSWDMGYDFGADLLEAINIVSRNKSVKRLDGTGFKVYWAGEILRVDIQKEEVT